MGVRVYDTERWRKARKAVLRRDRWTCQHCGKRGGYLNVHHLDGRKRNLNLDNLITLCRECHESHHFNYQLERAILRTSMRALRHGCFIATAAFGTPYANEIDKLRKWRDDKLAKKAAGKLFIRIYYLVSPPIAKFISRREPAKKIVRLLIKIFVKLIKD